MTNQNESNQPIYSVFWNGKRINRVQGLESAKRTIKGTDRDYGPLPAGTLTYRKEQC